MGYVRLGWPTNDDGQPRFAFRADVLLHQHHVCARLGLRQQQGGFRNRSQPNGGNHQVQGAAPFYQWTVNNPGPANALAPMAFRYLFGVTPWAQQGNTSTINTVLTAYGNL